MGAGRAGAFVLLWKGQCRLWGSFDPGPGIGAHPGGRTGLWLPLVDGRTLCPPGYGRACLGYSGCLSLRCAFGNVDSHCAKMPCHCWTGWCCRRWAFSASQAIFGPNQTWSDNLIAIVMNAIVATYFIYVLRKDWQVIAPQDSFTNIRRIYRHIWLIYSLGILVGSRTATTTLSSECLPGCTEFSIPRQWGTWCRTGIDRPAAVVFCLEDCARGPCDSI